MATNFCEKCTKTMDEDNFYTYKDGRKTEMCKKCLTMHIDNFDEKTYLWLLEKMDVPYVPSEWITLRDRAYAKNPNLNGMSVFGKYLSKMKLKQWKGYGWADTKELQEKDEKAKQAYEDAHPELEERKKFIQEQYEAGEISEAQYKTLIDTEVQNANYIPGTVDIGPNNAFDENLFLAEDEMPDPGADLTMDDKMYLAVKWGRLYKPNDWIALETKYDEMMNSFDIQDADTKASLILLCKTDLKMNQAIDCGDLDGYQKLSRVYDSLRKSMKLTAAQNKEQNNDFVDSIGEFVRMCEKEEGFIPTYATDIPQDKVDLTLKDMNNYLYKLVTQDLGFGQQIEDSLKKIQIQKEMNEAERESSDFDDPQELVDQEYEDFYQEIEGQREKDFESEVE